MEISTPSKPVDIDAAAFADAFSRRSIAVRHRLAGHPLFTIDAIAELADRLPPESVRRERGNLPLANSGGYVDVGDGPPSETIRNVERTGTRVSLRDIQQTPEYAELIDECLDQVEPLVAERQGGMTQRAGYLFISCSNSTTPMHFDREHSFLLQVKGVKHVTVAAFQDDPAALRRELDRWVEPSGRARVGGRPGRPGRRPRSRASRPSPAGGSCARDRSASGWSNSSRR